MVMGPTHAMSGAAVGLGLAAVIPPGLGGPSSLPESLVWAGVVAGAALFPDLDTPQSTVSRAFGPVTEGLSRLIGVASLSIYEATSSRKDSHRESGHRTFTHTALFAVLLGILVAVAIASIGKNALIVTLFVFLGLALKGLAEKWAKRETTFVVVSATAILTAAAYYFIPSETGSAALGLAVAIGCITHVLGDMITKQGGPLLAPLVVINGKRWWEVALPGPLRITADSTFERVIILPACTLIAAALLVVVVHTHHPNLSLTETKPSPAAADEATTSQGGH